MEFTEYLAPDHMEGVWIARKLPEGMDSLCVVSHEDAGGPCERPIVFEVYGVPFCEVHGIEANVGAMAQLHDEAMDEFGRMDNVHALPIQPEFLRVVRSERGRSFDDHIRYARQHERLLLEAYPLIRERVDQETSDWQPGDLDKNFTGGPVDWWAAEYRHMCSFMLQASRSRETNLARELEPVREHAAAQYAFAQVVGEEKIEAHKAARAK